MDLSALLLSRLQFAFTVSFHIVFPSFTIGLAAWLTTIEALHLATGRPAYRIVFEFWLKIFGIAFGLGVVSGIVMAFQFGTNWSELSRASGPIQGPLDLAQINGAGDPVQRIAGDPVAVLGQCRQGCVALNLGLQAVANRDRGLSVGRERLAVYRVANT